jgi:peptide deformylase
MAILKVARLGHPVLRQPGQELTRSALRSAEVQGLIDDMIETMAEYDGAGLAAPQVHQSLRLAVLEVPGGEGRPEIPLLVLANPILAPLGEEKNLGWEGCLSVPDLRGRVARFTRVRLEALDRQGKSFSLDAEDFFARVLQHECDHLDGRVFLDRMEDLSSLSYLSEFDRFSTQDEREEGEAGLIA